MDRLQTGNPEPDILKALAGSGVMVPGQTDEQSRQVLLGRAAESNDHPDLLESAMDGSLPQVAQTGGATPQTQSSQPTYQAPPQQPQQPTAYQPSQQEQQLFQQLQAERATNMELRQRSEVADAFESLLNEDPELAQQFLARIGKAPAQATNTDGTATPQQQQYDRRVYAEMNRLRQENKTLAQGQDQLRLNQESWALSQQFPDLYNEQAVDTYRRAQGFRSMTDAFRHMLGTNVQTIIMNNRRQAANPYAYAQQPGYQGYQPQQPQGYPSQNGYAIQQPQQPYAGGAYPPPAANAMDVMRPGTPGGNTSNTEAINSFRPKNKEELKQKARAWGRANGLIR